MFRLVLDFFKSLKFRIPNSDIIILHENDNWIRKSLGKSFNINTISVAPEKFNIYFNIKVIKFLIVDLRSVNLGNWFKGSGVRKFCKRIYVRYLLSVIKVASPKVVITYIDNSTVFQCLSTIDNTRRYIAVQNSVRNQYNVKFVLENDTNHGKIIHDIFFCFGPSVKNLYNEHNHSVNLFSYSGGSLAVSHFLKNNSYNESSEKYDICLISQWIKRNFENDNKQLGEAAISIKKATILLLNEISNFMIKTNKSLVVCLRTSDPNEKLFYSKFFKNDISFVSPKDGKFSSYSGFMESKVVVGVSSTLLIEALSLGKKSLWCNLDNHKFHKIIQDENHVCNVIKRQDFFKKLNYLLETSNNLSEKKLLKIRNDLCPLDYNDLPHLRLKRLVMKIIND